MTSHINTRDLVAQNLSTREAILASVIAEIHTMADRAEKLPIASPDCDLPDFASKLLMLTAPVLDLVLGRKQHRPGDVSRIELIGKLSQMQVPLMPMYPNESDIDAHEDYTNKVQQLMEEHIEHVDKALPISGDLCASYRWCEDVASEGYDQRGR
jgi:hypothetical protein